jgi:hypothetical protein
MISRAGLLTVAGILAMASMACSSSSGGGGTGGAGNMMPGGGNMMPGGNPGGNNPPTAAGNVLGTDPAPDSTDPAPNATDPAPSATDPAPNAIDPAPTATDLPVGVGGVTAPGSAGGGDFAGAPDCSTLCNSISQSCPAPQDLLDQCMEGCHEALEAGCYAEMGAAVACAAAAACAAQGNVEIIEAQCSEAFQAVDCNGTVQPGPGQGEGGQPSVPGGGGSGCAGLQACCAVLEEGAAECNQIASLGVAQACDAALSNLRIGGVCQ